MDETVRDAAARQVRVWDVFVRGFHWALVAAFATAYVSEGKPIWLHSWAGYLILGLLVLRLVWGVIGPRYARFANFVAGPRAVLAYLRALVTLRAPRHLGHSPAGGAMVVALMVCLALTAGTGCVLYAADDGAGPFAGVVSQIPRLETVVTPPGKPSRKARDPRVRAIKEVHEILANLTLALIVLHLGGVALASFAHRENLPRSMVTGLKTSRPNDIA